MEVAERDPVHLNCTSSSSCKQSCTRVFIVVQLMIIAVVSLCLRSLETSSSYDNYLIDKNADAEMNMANDTWATLPDKMERLSENPVYSKFNISRKTYRPRVNLVLIISSAPQREDRRNAIRDTWLQDCINEKLKVKCMFLTDWKENSTALLEEKSKHYDIEFQDLKGGVEFGKRFMYHMVWAIENFDFDYFMRIDDDYFFCLKRFLNELPLPRLKMYHWGYVHCVDSIVRPEESITMLSRDLVEAFLGQNSARILCHPWADQMIALWVAALKLKKLYNHDNRIHHDPPVSRMKNLSNDVNDVCRRYIGLHGSYPADTRKLWSLRGTQGNLGTQLGDFTVKCEKRQVFKWDFFKNEWRYKPKLCIQDPKWDTYGQEKGKGVYLGRQGG